YKTLALFSNHGVVSNPHILSQADLHFLQASIDHCCTVYLDELQQELVLKWSFHASLSTLSQAMKQLHITHKIVAAPALDPEELDHNNHALYMNCIGAKVPDARHPLHHTSCSHTQWYHCI
ncbi:hypothetical protein PAXRUDRAFT_150972, partial [Paxillus rubicundulus Ve08.2h10]